MNKRKQQRQKLQKFVLHASNVISSNRVWFACVANQIQISNKIEEEKGRDREKGCVIVTDHKVSDIHCDTICYM